MDIQEERHAVSKVVDTLAGHFPDLGRDRIADVVQEQYATFTGNPIRDYIPVLVEHGARDRLREEAQGVRAR